MAPGASSPTKALGQRSIASMFSNSDRFAKAGGGGRAPRLPLMEFLARKLDKRSVSSVPHQVRFSPSLSLYVLLPASDFPFI